MWGQNLKFLTNILFLGKSIHEPFDTWVGPWIWDSHVGRRTDFRDKNRELFSGELFSGEELLPENRFLGQ